LVLLRSKGQGKTHQYANAEQGDPYSQWKLGTIYQLNNQDSDAARDLQLALKWFTLAAQQGLSQAQESLGSMYERGEGVPQDTETALKWYALALDSDAYAASK